MISGFVDVRKHGTGRFYKLPLFWLKDIKYWIGRFVTVDSFAHCGLLKGLGNIRGY